MLDALIQAVYNLLSLIGITNPSSSGTDTVMNYLRKLDNKKKKLVITTTVTSYATTETDIVNVSGKGRLLEALAYALGTPTSSGNTLKIYVDSTLTYSSKATAVATAGSFSGVIRDYETQYTTTSMTSLSAYVKSITRAFSSSELVGASARFALVTLSAYPKTSASNNAYVLAPDGIEFNSSLRITLTQDTGITGGVSFAYELEE